MAICGPAVIPHSHFLGGPPVWTELDRAKQREWHRREQEKCPVHGIHPEVFDPEQGGDLDALMLAPGHRRCCEIAETQGEGFEDKRLPGMHQVWKYRPPEELSG